MGYGDRVDKPPSPPIGGGLSRVSLPSRLEPRRGASGTDWRTVEWEWELDGGGAIWTPDTIGYEARIVFPCQFSEIYFHSRETSRINFDIWRHKFDWTSSGLLATVADTILPAPIALVDVKQYNDRILANVNKVVQAGDILTLYVNTATLFKRASVGIILERSI